MEIPKLIIVAEHDICTSTQEWFSRVQLFASLLNTYPKTVLQIRAKTRPELRSWAYKQLPHHPYICINGYTNDAKPPMVHFPQSQVPANPKSPFGMSIHHHCDPKLYDSLSPLYYQLGPIYSPISKRGNPQGLSIITETKRCTDTPIIAVGGITPSNIKDVIRAGACGVASSGFLLQSTKPEEALHTLYLSVHKALDL